MNSQASILQKPTYLDGIIAERQKTNPLGIAGALFETLETFQALQAAGKALIQLTEQALLAIHDGQCALISSHDGTMVAAERLLKHIPFDEPLDRTYGELEGFVVDQDLNLKNL